MFKYNGTLRYLRYLRIVGDNDQRRSLTVKLLENIDYNIFISFIKISCRFVGKDDLGMVNKRTGNTNMLLFSARKLAR